MEKKIVKIESIAEFLARGGTITKVPFRRGKRRNATASATEASDKVNLAVIPDSLKISLGLK